MTDEPVAAEETETPARRTSALAWVVIVIVLAAAAVGSTWMLRPSGEDRGLPAPEAVQAVLPLDTFVVNLADPDEKAYLRIGISLGFDHKLEGKESVPVALVRDAILGVLAASKPGDLLTSAGKEKLKADLLQALAARAPRLGIREVYFTEFLIQR